MDSLTILNRLGGGKFLEVVCMDRVKAAKELLGDGYSLLRAA